MNFARIFSTRRFRKPETAITLGPLAKLARMPSYREAQPLFVAELARARRYQRPLSLLVMRCPGANGTNGGNGNAGAHTDPGYPQLMISLLLGVILPDRIRETDLVCHDAAAQHYIVLMPELTRPQAERAVERLNELVRAQVPAPTCVGVAEFPGDGLTLEEMVASAEKNHELLLKIKAVSA